MSKASKKDSKKDRIVARWIVVVYVWILIIIMGQLFGVNFGFDISSFYMLLPTLFLFVLILVASISTIAILLEKDNQQDNEK